MSTKQFLNHLFCVLMLFLLFPSLSNANGFLTISSGRGEPFLTVDQRGFYDLIVKNMFERIGVKAKTVLLPSERSLLNANAGIDDGNIARIKGVEKKYTNLVIVPEKVIDFEFVAFTKNKQIKVENWVNLKPYNVAFINGWKVFEQKVTDYKTLVRTRDSQQLFELLDNNRVDVALYDLWSGVWWAKKYTSGTLYRQPPIASFELYLYLHKKHQKLVPKLVKALKDMKLDGTYQQIYDETLTQLLD